MEIATVPIPIRCAQCGIVSMPRFPKIVVFTALTRWRQMRLYSVCHDVYWDASPLELASIREHVGERWLKAYSRTPANRLTQSE